MTVAQLPTTTVVFPLVGNPDAPRLAAFIVSRTPDMATAFPEPEASNPDCPHERHRRYNFINRCWRSYRSVGYHTIAKRRLNDVRVLDIYGICTPTKHHCGRYGSKDKP